MTSAFLAFLDFRDQRVTQDSLVVEDFLEILEMLGPLDFLVIPACLLLPSW